MRPWRPTSPSTPPRRLTGPGAWPTRSVRPPSSSASACGPTSPGWYGPPGPSGDSRSWRALRLRAHAHTLGYTGQFSSKSLRYSTTFSALRDARVLYVKGGLGGERDYDGEWRYAGRGYSHPEADDLAHSLFEASRRVRQRVPQTSTQTSTTP